MLLTFIGYYSPTKNCSGEKKKKIVNRKLTGKGN